MNLFLFDASALSKRYTLELGCYLVDHLFANLKSDRFLCLLLGVGEIMGVFVRKRNRGQISKQVFSQAITDFTVEVIQAKDFDKIEPKRLQVIASWSFIEKHSLNATDALVLRVALDRAQELRQQGNDLVLVAADNRLLRAAQDEGLQRFNPETDSQADLDVLISAR